MKTFMKTSWFVVGLLAAAGCARVQIPDEQLRAPETITRAAREAGADAVPAARLHLDLARDQEQLAKDLAAEGDPRAQLVLARAQVDAEMALELTREATAKGEAAAAAIELKTVRGVK